MNGVSQIGLLKIDLLGLSNLTVIAEAAEMVRAHRGIDLDIDQIALDDTKTYELLGKADTHGIFQLEATFAKRILIDMQPKRLEDIGVAVALNRPGPIEGGAPAIMDAPQARRGAGDVHAPRARADPEGDLRRDPLPGSGDEDRIGSRRVHAWRGGHPSSRDGQEGQGEDGQAARASSCAERPSVGWRQTRRCSSSTSSRSSPDTGSTALTASRTG